MCFYIFVKTLTLSWQYGRRRASLNSPCANYRNTQLGQKQPIRARWRVLALSIMLM